MEDFYIVDPQRWTQHVVSKLKTEYILPEECYAGICVDAGCNVGGFELVHGTRFDIYYCIDILDKNLDLLEENVSNSTLIQHTTLKACYKDNDGIMPVYAHSQADGSINYFGNCGNVGVVLHNRETHPESVTGEWGWWEKNKLYDIETISLERIHKIYPEIMLLKIDIEGGEYDFLMNKDLSKINYITGEFHMGYANPNSDLMLHIKKTHDVIHQRDVIYTFKRR